MSSKAYELLAKVKDLSYISGTSRDSFLLQRLNLAEWRLYTMEYHWRGLEQSTDLTTTSPLLTLDVAPGTAWTAGDTITGATSGATCVVVAYVTTLTYTVRSVSGTFTLGEILSNGTYTADQGTSYPTITYTPYGVVPSAVGVIYTIRQVSDSPYQKLSFLSVPKFHEFIPQPTMYGYNKPTHYTWWGENLWFYPIPDAPYTLTIYHYARPVGMKIYTTGTAVHSGLTITGTSTHWLDNANVSAGMFFAYQSDVRSDGTYPWAEIASVSADGTATLAESYTGSLATGSYVMTSESIFPPDFDLALIYQAAIWENMRNREMGQSIQIMKEEYKEAFSGLLKTQRAHPDQIVEAGRFQTEPFILGDDAAKFPFIGGNL